MRVRVPCCLFCSSYPGHSSWWTCHRFPGRRRGCPAPALPRLLPLQRQRTRGQRIYCAGRNTWNENSWVSESLGYNTICIPQTPGSGPDDVLVIVGLHDSLTVSARTNHSGGGSWRSEGWSSGGQGQGGGRGAAYRKRPGQPRAQRLTACCRLRRLTETHTKMYK